MSGRTMPTSPLGARTPSFPASTTARSRAASPASHKTVSRLRVTTFRLIRFTSGDRMRGAGHPVKQAPENRAAPIRWGGEPRLGPSARWLPRLAPPQLPAVPGRPDRLPGRHLDAAGRARLARVPADGLGVPAWPRRLRGPGPEPRPLPRGRRVGRPPEPPPDDPRHAEPLPRPGPRPL